MIFYCLPTEQSRKSSRTQSRRGSMDIVEEEELLVLNPNTEFSEEKDEEDLCWSDEEDPSSSRRISRRPSIVSLPTGRWSRRSSVAGVEFLKMEDEVRLVRINLNIKKDYSNRHKP